MSQSELPQLKKPNIPALVGIFLLIAAGATFLFYRAYADDRVSGDFKEYGSTAIDSLSRLQESRLDGSLLYEPRLMDAERNVDAAKRHTHTSADARVSSALDSYLSQIKNDRQIRRLQNDTFDLMKRNGEADLAAWHKVGKAAATKAIEQWSAENTESDRIMAACRDEARTTLTNDLSNKGQCRAAIDERIAHTLADIQKSSKN